MNCVSLSVDPLSAIFFRNQKSGIHVNFFPVHHVYTRHTGGEGSKYFWTGFLEYDIVGVGMGERWIRVDSIVFVCVMKFKSIVKLLTSVGVWSTLPP